MPCRARRPRTALVVLAFAGIGAAAGIGPAAAAPAASHRPGPARLPEEIAPTAQRPHLTIDPREGTFKGTVAIGLDLRTPVSTISFHARDITITKAEAIVSGRPLPAVVSEAAGAGAEPDQGEKMATFTEPLPKGAATM